ncbi:MAG: hypothetical protein OXH65_05135 [Paracoccaceae bacterium]|nr:hypothetical protein [Paracoccaceae bacterium]
MNTMNESYDRGWKHLGAKIGEDNARRDAELAKRDKNMSIQIYAVAFGIVVVILGIGGIIISLLV